MGAQKGGRVVASVSDKSVCFTGGVAVTLGQIRAASSGGPGYSLLACSCYCQFGLKTIDEKVPANSLVPMPWPTVTNSSFAAPLVEFPPPKAIPQRLLSTITLPS